MAEEKSPFTNKKAGKAFLIDPKGKQGPGILVLHSWWGLTEQTKDFCKKLADEGYTSLAPDLMAGEKPESEEEGAEVLAQLDPDELSGLVMSSAQALRAASEDPQKPIAVIGFSMGASLAYWLSTKLPENVSAVVAFYGSQSIDFDNATAIYQGHYAEDDHMVSEDDKVATESFLRLGGKETEFYTYPETKHWFFEQGKNYNEEAAELAWQRLKEFLNTNFQTG